MIMLGAGLECLDFGAKVFDWQVRRGKKAVFEHPSPSRPWEEDCAQRVLHMPGVVRVRGDRANMDYGLQELSKKPTDFMVNGGLPRRCQGGRALTSGL